MESVTDETGVAVHIIKGGVHYNAYHVVFDIQDDSNGEDDTTRDNTSRINFDWIEQFGKTYATVEHYGCKTEKYHGHALITMLCKDNGRPLAKMNSIVRQYFKQHDRDECTDCTELSLNKSNSRSFSRCSYRYCAMTCMLTPVKDDKHFNNTIQYIEKLKTDAINDKRDDVDEEPSECIEHLATVHSCIKCVTRVMWELDQED